jgi:hypothetical protein
MAHEKENLKKLLQHSVDKLIVELQKTLNDQPVLSDSARMTITLTGKEGVKTQARICRCKNAKGEYEFMACHKCKNQGG